jgi:hypothetical protein
VLDPNQCPADPDEIAEAYLLHHLAPEETRAFEDHYMTCGRCAGIVADAEAFIVAMKRAAESLRRDGGK